MQKRQNIKLLSTFTCSNGSNLTNDHTYNAIIVLTTDLTYICNIMIRNVNLTYLYQVQHKMIDCYVHHYDQDMFVVVNNKCIGLKDPINIVTIVQCKMQRIKDIV